MSKLLKFVLGGAPALIYDHLKSNDQGNNSAATSISKDEVLHINDIINNAKNQGLSEVSIEISRQLHDELSLGGSLPIPSGINADMSLKSNVSGSGKCVLHIVFPTPDENLEKLIKLKKIYEAGVLTEQEFIIAKAKVIDNL